MRKLIRIVLVLVLILVVAVVGLVIYLDRIAKTAIESGATYTLGVPTTLENVRIGLVKGEFQLKGLNVANPSGYEAGPHFLHLKDGQLNVKMGTLTSDKVVAPKLELSGIDMVLEKKEGKANYEVILDNMKKQEEAEEKKPESAEGKKFAVEEIVIRDVTVHAFLFQVGSQKPREVTVPIDEIRATYDSEDGATVQKLTNLVLSTILVAVAQNAGDLLPGVMLDTLSEGLKGLESIADIEQAGVVIEGVTKEVGEVGKAVTEQLEGATKKVDESLEGLGKGLGGLLGGDKKKSEPKE